MIAVVAGRLMNAAAWNKIPLVVSCALVPTERISAIIKAWENVGGTWNKNERRGDESSEGGTLSEHSSSQLKHRVEQIATHEEEMGKNMEEVYGSNNWTVGPTGRRIENTIESTADQSGP